MMKTAILALAIAATLSVPAWADVVDPATVKKGYVGPETPYGETPEEVAAKKVLFDKNYVAIIEQDVRKAYELYVSKDFCEHSHMTTRALKRCVGYEDSLADQLRRFKRRAPGALVEIPLLASVNGEMVTMYGQGVDIFRVRDGKITDHWDASPSTEVTIPAHAPGFKEWVLGDRKGPPPMLPKPKN